MNQYHSLIINNVPSSIILMLMVLLSGCAQASSGSVENKSSYNGTRSDVSTDIQRMQWAQFRFQNVDRNYLLYSPASYSEQTPSALIVVLHGGHGDAGKTADRTGFKPLADQEGFLVLYPEAAEKHWNDGRKTTASNIDDVAFINALIDHVAKQRQIDKQRVYVTGLSNGGMMTQRLACESPQRFSAFASVIANLPVSMKAVCKPGQPVSMMLINGTDDPLMPYAGGEIRKGRRIGLGGTVVSVQETVRFWADNSHCQGSGDVANLPDKDTSDDTRINKTRFTDCYRGSEVVFYSVEGGGHTWPGSNIKPLLRRISGNVSRDMNASEVIWNFFQRHTGQ